METRTPQPAIDEQQSPKKLDWSFCQVSLAIMPFDWSIEIGPNNNFGMRHFNFKIGPVHLCFSGPLETDT